MLLSTSTTEGVTLIDEQYGKIIDWSVTLLTSYK
jgi:hypothetical protein